MKTIQPFFHYSKNMITKQTLRNLALCVAATGFFAGCATANYNKAASTSAALTESAALVAKGSDQIDRSLAALNDLMTNAQPDLRVQFKTFDTSVNDLGDNAKAVSSEAEDMQAQGTAYFDEWDKELAGIRNEDIRTRSENRKDEATAKFTRMGRQYDATKAAFKPFMSDLRDVQKFLATDLTVDGLAAIKVPANKAAEDAVPLKQSLVDLSTQFADMGVSLAPSAPAQVTAK